MNRIFEKYMKLTEKAHLEDGTFRSKEWFRKLASSEPHIFNIGNLVKNLDKPKKISPGMLLVFEYSPKTKQDLDYWDRTPLVFVTGLTKDGWVGVNMHYIHPKIRARMFYDYQREGKPIVSGDVAKSATRKYFSNQVVGFPKVVPDSMWEMVVQMPFENFSGVGKNKAWRDTNRKIK